MRKGAFRDFKDQEAHLNDALDPIPRDSLPESCHHKRHHTRRDQGRRPRRTKISVGPIKK